MKNNILGTERLAIYGSPASQPTRPVYWCCLIKKLPFEARYHENWRDKYQPEFLKLNPLGMVPTIVDNGFALGEMAAILKYLSVKHGWDDFYPQDQKVQARIDQYLCVHQTMTRMATMALMGVFVTNGVEDMLKASTEESPSNVTRGTFIVPAKYNPQALEIGQATVTRLSKILEALAFPNENTFFCGTPQPTIADFAAYAELAQLQWANLFDFSGFPRIRTWLAEMEKQPYHDVVHEYNFALGDIRTKQNTAENYYGAIDSFFARIEREGVVVTRIP